MIGIYSVYNKTKGKHYIGSSTDIQKRLETHRQFIEEGKGLGFILQRDITDEYEFKVIKELKSDVELESFENYYIGKYDSINNGYNKILARRRPNITTKTIKTTIDNISLLNGSEIAEFLKISEDELNTLSKEKGFPALRLGKTTRRYCREDVINWLYENTALNVYEEQLAENFKLIEG